MSALAARGNVTPALARPPRLGMARASWQVHRRELLSAFALLAVIALLLVVNGIFIRAEPVRLRPHLQGAIFGSASSGPATSTTNWLMGLLFLPFVLGGFTGARLVGGDLDRGTVRFAWTQSVTRVRWVGVNLLVTGLLLGGVAALTGLAFAWWDQPFAVWRLDDPAFGLYPPVFAAWTVTSFALAAFLGAAVRGVVAVIATTTGVTVVLALVNASFLRPYHYLPPLTRPWRDAPAGSVWFSQSYTWLNGRPISSRALDRISRLPGSRGFRPQWLAQHHVLTWVTFQPPGRFWQFQLIQSGGLLALAVLFGALAVWRVRRHSVWPRAKGPA